jgi:general secretion pathway protein H
MSCRPRLRTRASKARLRPPRESAAGFTLLEILVALAVVALMFTLVLGGVRRLARTELRGSAGKLASVVRYLFDRASTTGKIHRLVLDFETGKYWAEVSDDRFLLPRERETDQSRARDVDEANKAAEDEKEKQKEAERTSELAAGNGTNYDFSRYQPTEWKPKRARFELFQERTLKVTQLKGAKLADLFTPRYAGPVTTGRGYIYFFPLGQTEPALIRLTDTDGTTFYSLLVHPLNGRVKVYAGRIEPRVDQQYDDEGTVLDQP